MATPDHYEVLQVHPLAEAEVIQAAYRRLAMKYHPDVSPGPQAQQRMAQLNQAYAVLRDPQKRRAYDRQRGAGVAFSAAAPATYTDARVEVVPSSLDFGAVALGQSRALKIRVVNLGSGRLAGAVRCLAPWLKAVPADLNGNDVEVTVRFQPLTPGSYRSGNALEVATSAGTVLVAATGSCVLAGQHEAGPSRVWVDAATTWNVPRPVVRRPARKGVPFVATVAVGAVLTGAVWFAIYPPLAVVPAALAAYLVWRRQQAQTRREQQVVRQARRAPTGLGRCAACGTRLDPLHASKCAHCGGNICPGCGACPCGRAQR